MPKGSFKISREARGGRDVISLVGPLDAGADAQLNSLIEHAGRICMFDFGGISNITSDGVRAWMLFLREFRVNRQIFLSNCTPGIVAHLNMTQGFAQGATVQSVLAPMRCPKCSDQTGVTVDLASPSVAQNASASCPTCGTKITIPTGYLDFLDAKKTGPS